MWWIWPVIVAISVISANPQLGVVLAIGLAIWQFGPDLKALLKRGQGRRKMEARLADNPHDLRTREALAEIHDQAGRFPAVVELLEPAHERDPDSRMTLYLLGRALVEQDQPDRAEPMLTRLVERQSDYRMGEGQLRLAQLELRRQQYDAAATWLETHLSINGSSAEGLYTRMELELARGEKESAQAAFQKLREALRSAPRFRRRLDRRWLWKARRRLWAG